MYHHLDIGKTTLLRDLIRIISDNGFNVGVVDERGEISATFNGNTKLNLGLRTDVISKINKSQGMNMLIRSMGLDVISTDEIGNNNDIIAIKNAVTSGISLLFTMHGKNMEDILSKDNILDIISFFDYIIIMGKFCISEIIDVKEYFKNNKY